MWKNDNTSTSTARAAIVCSVILLWIGILGAFMLIIHPRLLFDLAFKDKMVRELENNGVLRMADIAEFDWDTMYYSWVGYFSEDTIKDKFEDKNNIIRDTNDESDNHILFVNDGVRVKHEFCRGL